MSQIQIPEIVLMLILFRDTSTLRQLYTPPFVGGCENIWEKREYFQNLVTTHNVQWFPVVGIIFLRHYNSLAVESNCSFSSFIEFGIWKTAQNSPLMCRISCICINFQYMRLCWWKIKICANHTDQNISNALYKYRLLVATKRSLFSVSCISKSALIDWSEKM